jgi:hypothetical protein
MSQPALPYRIVFVTFIFIGINVPEHFQVWCAALARQVTPELCRLPFPFAQGQAEYVGITFGIIGKSRIP